MEDQLNNDQYASCDSESPERFIKSSAKQHIMKKETTLTSGYSERDKQIKKSVRFIKPQSTIIMAITIPKECPLCGTQFDQEEYKECPHCEDNEFDPYNVFQDADNDYL